MASDIRLSTDVFQHPKLITLQRLAGSRGVLSLVKLWCYAGKFHTTGSLTQMSVEEIENAAQWTGKKGEFVDILFQLKLLKKRNNFCIINDWNLHQPFVFSEQKRIKRAQDAAKARWKTHNKHKLKAGKNGDAKRMLSACESHQLSNAKSMPHLLSTPLVDKRSSSIVNIPIMYKEITKKDLKDDDLKIIQTYEDDLIQSAFEKMQKYKGKSAAYLIKVLKSLKADRDIEQRENQITDEKLLDGFLRTARMYPSDYPVASLLKSYETSSVYTQIKSIIESIGFQEGETITEFQQKLKGVP